MDAELFKQFRDLMFETCRDQSDEVRNYNGPDAGEKLRRCYNKFYMLVKHQNDYYQAMSDEEFKDLTLGKVA